MKMPLSHRLALVACTLLTAALPLATNSVKADDDKPPFKQYLDSNTAPGNNFFQYATGGWPVKRRGLAPQFNGADSLEELSRLNSRKLNQTIERIYNSNTSPTDLLMQTFMRNIEDTATTERLGLTPLKNKLAEFDHATNFADLMLASADPAYGLYGPLVHAVQPSRTDPNAYALFVATHGFTLPPQVYGSASRQAKEIRNAHERMLAFLLQQTGENQARTVAKQVMKLEEKLAHLFSNSRKGAAREVTDLTLEQLSTISPNLPWQGFIDAAGLQNIATLTAVEPQRLGGLNQLAAGTDLAVWKAYFKTQLLVANKAYLPPSIKKAVNLAAKTYSDDANHSLSPQQSAKIEATQWFSDYLGHRFAADHVSAATRAKITAMTTAIKAAFKVRMETSSIFTAETRAFALKKLAAMRAEIAEPSKPLDYRGMTFEAGDLFGNIKALRIRERSREAALINGEANHYVQWQSPAYTANALYSPNQNAILLPAGFMQTPLFYPGADDAYNYGSFGTIIGHEIAHAFDDRGRHFGADGTPQNWWQPDDIKKFNALSDVLINQYETYAKRTGTSTNARRTLGENIADIIGIQIAYDAYMATRPAGAAKTVSGFSEQQRFYLGLAQKRRARPRGDAANALLALDTHSHGAIRLNGALRNIDSWFEAFAVGKGDFLYQAPENRVSFW